MLQRVCSAVIATGKNGGRLTDILNRDGTTDRLFDFAFKDACCNQEGADCTLYTDRRSLIPLKPHPPPPPPPPDPPRPPMRIPRRRRRINTVPSFIIRVIVLVFGKLGWVSRAH